MTKWQKFCNIFFVILTFCHVFFVTLSFFISVILSFSSWCFVIFFSVILKFCHVFLSFCHSVIFLKIFCHFLTLSFCHFVIVTLSLSFCDSVILSLLFCHVVILLWKLTLLLNTYHKQQTSLSNGYPVIHTINYILRLIISVHNAYNIVALLQLRHTK